MAKKATEGQAELTVTEAAGNGSKSVTLSFTTPAELDIYNALKTAAENDDRSVNSFIVRVLQGKEMFNKEALPPAGATE